MRTILKQTSWLFFAQALSRIISFFYVIYLARNLGVSDFGLYSVVLAYFSIISGIADLGFNRFLTREVAKDKLKATTLLWPVVLIRLTLTSILFLIFSIFLYSWDSNAMRVSLTLLATLAILPQAVALTFDAIFVAIQKLQFSAVSLFISSLTTALLGFLLVSNGLGPLGAVNALILGQVTYFLVLLIFLYKLKLLVFSKVNLNLVKKTMMGSLPYGLLSVLGLLYFRIDIVLLSYLRGNFETGIYGAAYKFLEALVFIPNAFSLALFPKFAQLHQTDSVKLRKILYHNIRLIFLVGISIAVSYVVILPQVIKIFLPNYLSSITVIQILAFSIPFMFIHIPASTVLTSSDKYLKAIILLSLGPLLVNIFLNLTFIPRYGFIAAALITVFSDILSAALLFAMINKLIPKND